MEFVVIADRRLPIPDAELIRIGGHLMKMMVIRDANPGPYPLSDTYSILLPDRIRKAVIVVGMDGEYQIIPCPYKIADASNRIRIFACPHVGKFGVRTSLNWNKTHWARKMMCIKGEWIVAVCLPKGKLEYKNVARGLDCQFIWEPSSFMNKQLTLGPDAEFIEGIWSRLNVDRHVLIPEHVKTVHVTMTLSDTEVKSMLLETGNDNHLALNNISDAKDCKIQKICSPVELQCHAQGDASLAVLSDPGKVILGPEGAAILADNLLNTENSQSSAESGSAELTADINKDSDIITATESGGSDDEPT